MSLCMGTLGYQFTPPETIPPTIRALWKRCEIAPTQSRHSPNIKRLTPAGRQHRHNPKTSGTNPRWNQREPLVTTSRISLARPASARDTSHHTTYGSRKPPSQRETPVTITHTCLAGTSPARHFRYNPASTSHWHHAQQEVFGRRQPARARQSAAYLFTLGWRPAELATAVVWPQTASQLARRR